MAKEYRKYLKDNCQACGHNGSLFPLDPDHWITRGARPDLLNDERNIITLCRKCHSNKGQIGRRSFIKRFPILINVLENNGFEYDEYMDDWYL